MISGLKFVGMKKFELVKQRDSSDCGAACLVSVAAHFGLHIPVEMINHCAVTDTQGASMHGLIETAKLLGFNARGVKVTADSLAGIPVPSVFHLVSKNDLQHFVVVYKIKKSGIFLMDPAIGKLVLVPFPEFIESWSGAILLLIPSKDFQKCNLKKSLINRLRQWICPLFGLR
jgi:ATP-binding cassette, subfamily C, bacteriocin exporter